jgi:alpha-L-fucosidase
MPGPEHMLSVDKLVDLLVDVVSKNGNLLSNVGPKADGTLPPLQAERLKGLGNWLRVNGEAIFGTRPWVRAEGRTRDGLPVRYTVKEDSAYAILLEKPKEGKVVIEAIMAEDKSRIQLLGSSQELRWSQTGKALSINLPDIVPTSEAYVLKITPKPWQLVRD